jgi:hypothetical protein
LPRDAVEKSFLHRPYATPFHATAKRGWVRPRSRLADSLQFPQWRGPEFALLFLNSTVPPFRQALAPATCNPYRREGRSGAEYARKLQRTAKRLGIGGLPQPGPSVFRGAEHGTKVVAVPAKPAQPVDVLYLTYPIGGTNVALASHCWRAQSETLTSCEVGPEGTGRDLLRPFDCRQPAEPPRTNKPSKELHR